MIRAVCAAVAHDARGPVRAALLGADPDHIAAASSIATKRAETILNDWRNDADVGSALVRHYAALNAKIFAPCRSWSR